MADDKNASQAAEEQPGHISRTVEALQRRMRRALSPWVQRSLERRGSRDAVMVGSGRSRPGPLTTGHTSTLLRRMQRTVDRATIWKPNIGSLAPAMVQRFARGVAERNQPLGLVGVQRQAQPAGMDWADEMELPLPVGPAASGQASASSSTITGPSIFSVGQQIPRMQSGPTAGPRAPRQVRRTAAPPPVQRKPIAPNTRLFSRVEYVTPGRAVQAEAQDSAASATESLPEEQAEASLDAPTDIIEEQPPLPEAEAPPSTTGPSMQGEGPAPPLHAPVRTEERAPAKPSASQPPTVKPPVVQRKTDAKPPAPAAQPEPAKEDAPIRPKGELATFFGADRIEDPGEPPATPHQEMPEPEPPSIQLEPEPAPETEPPSIQRQVDPSLPDRPSVDAKKGPELPSIERKADVDMPLRKAPPRPPAPDSRPPSQAQPSDPADEIRPDPEPPAIQPEPEPEKTLQVDAPDTPESEEPLQREAQPEPHTQPPLVQRSTKLATPPETRAPGPVESPAKTPPETPSIQRQSEPETVERAQPAEEIDPAEQVSDPVLVQREADTAAPDESEVAESVAPQAEEGSELPLVQRKAEPATPVRGELSEPATSPAEREPELPLVQRQVESTAPERSETPDLREPLEPEISETPVVQRAGDPVPPPIEGDSAPTQGIGVPVPDAPKVQRDSLPMPTPPRSEAPPTIKRADDPETSVEEQPSPGEGESQPIQPKLEPSVSGEPEEQPPGPESGPRVEAPGVQRSEELDMPLRRTPRPSAPVEPSPEPVSLDAVPISEPRPPVEPSPVQRVTDDSHIPETSDAHEQVSGGEPPSVQREVTPSESREATAPPPARPYQAPEMPLQRPASRDAVPDTSPAETEPPVARKPPIVQRSETEDSPQETPPSLEATPERKAIHAQTTLGGDILSRTVSRARMSLSRLVQPLGRQRLQRAESPEVGARQEPGGTLEQVPGLVQRHTTSPALYLRTPDMNVGPDLPHRVLAARTGRQIQRTPTGAPMGDWTRPALQDSGLTLAPARAARREAPGAAPSSRQAATLDSPRPSVQVSPAATAQLQRMPTEDAEQADLPLVLPPAPAAPPAAETVQREVAPPEIETVSEAPVIQGALVQRASEGEDTGTSQDADLSALARQIYPLVKRLLAIERERRPSW